MQNMSPLIEKKRVLSLKEVCHMTGLSKSSVYRLQRNSNFPRSIKTGIRTMGWLREDIDAWLEECRKVSHE